VVEGPDLPRFRRHDAAKRRIPFAVVIVKAARLVEVSQRIGRARLPGHEVAHRVELGAIIVKPERTRQDVVWIVIVVDEHQPGAEIDAQFVDVVERGRRGVEAEAGRGDRDRRLFEWLGRTRWRGRWRRGRNDGRLAGVTASTRDSCRKQRGDRQSNEPFSRLQPLASSLEPQACHTYPFRNGLLNA